MDKQNYIREQCRRLKWEEEIDYKVIAEDLLNMNYNAFINFMNGYKDLGRERLEILEDYINNML